MQLKKSKNQYPKPHKTTTPKHQDDYVFVEKEGEDFTALKLISGPFASIVYHYGSVGFAPEPSGQTVAAGCGERLRANTSW